MPMSEYEIYSYQEKVSESKKTIRENVGLNENRKNFAEMINDPLILQSLSERLNLSKSQ